MYIPESKIFIKNYTFVQFRALNKKAKVEILLNPF